MAITRAYKNHGRWVVECECRMAFEVRPGQRTVACKPPDERHNPADYCGVSYDVLWPDHARIDAILSHRPDKLNQNWVPGESIGRLVAENLEHDLKVPPGEVGA